MSILEVPDKTNPQDPPPKAEIKPNNTETVKIEAKPEPKVEAKTETKKDEPKVEVKDDKKPEAKADAKDGKPHEVGEEDEIPETMEEAAQLSISKRALKGRITRAQKAALREYFGTDDPKEIKAKLDRAKELEEKEETARREALSELERHKEDLKKKDDEIMRMRRDLETREVKEVVTGYEATVNTAAERYIDPDDAELVVLKYQQHVMGLSNKQAKAFDDPKAVRAWFKEFAAKHPKYARTKVESRKLDAGGKVTDKDGKTSKDESRAKGEVAGDAAGAAGKTDFSSKGGKSRKEVNDALRASGSSVRI